MEQQQSTSQQRTGLGEIIRQIADQLKQESSLQIKATSHILGAAAQIAENHDRLISEVVDMVEEDLDHQAPLDQTHTFTVDSLKQQFRTLSEAKSHFGLKASSWATLTNKLNHSAVQNLMSADCSKASVTKRFDAIEAEIKIMRAEVSQILSLLKQLILDKE